MAAVVTSFIFIFLAALPGRTTFLLILLSARGKAKAVLLGAGAAFLLQAAISIGVGEILSLLSPVFVDGAIGVLFLYFSYEFWCQSRMEIEENTNAKALTPKTVFTMIFLAETGDVSQLAIATTAAESNSKMTIFFVAVAALWLITGLAIGAGNQLRRIVKPHHLQKIAAFIFLVVGLSYIAKAWLNAPA